MKRVTLARVQGEKGEMKLLCSFTTGQLMDTALDTRTSLHMEKERHTPSTVDLVIVIVLYTVQASGRKEDGEEEEGGREKGASTRGKRK